ncbi:MAG: NAD(P)-binding domain-containing protein [Actinobacteria bacterium]|nr:NAD(P)-binding domain-containing protein [Actinomycetota bacterium]MCB9413623.1 NAD(P)-binding domain-containing protein [Actinomycetota bacterium]
MPDTRTDVLVVGAGPIGLETAAVLADEGHRVQVVDAGSIGDTIARQFPPATRFFTSPERLALRGLPVPSATQEKTTGEEYLAYLRAFAAAHRLQVSTFTEVVAIRGRAGAFRVTVRDNWGRQSEIDTAVIVLATGGTAHPRRLGVPGEDLDGVRRALGDPHRYYGRRVLVIGGRNSAAESALRLYRVGARVSLAHRGEALNPRVKHWIRPEVESLLDEGEITRLMPREVVRIEPGRVILREPGGTATETTESIEVDDVLLQLGYTADRRIFELAGIPLTGARQAPEHDPATMATGVPGIYVVGTASAGTQDKFDVFIENSHQHADRVAAALAGRPAPAPTPPRPLPES